MANGDSRTLEHDAEQIHWPTISDPMALLDELERRLNRCEITISSDLEQIQRRLNAMESEVSTLQSAVGESRRENERLVVQLADRLTRLEESIS